MVYGRSCDPARASYFEVDSTESVWYSDRSTECLITCILKLTPQSQYGIDVPGQLGEAPSF